ncbi:hypothetical protein [Neptunicoccus sediminis]|uniref:hypothetical protein n=1 Tax=Neptunicoccus sediminis TaxID=1892596 RepID=UPI0008461852|nr:hypothetical protein [Neptunicoccus sediminis]
MSKLSNIVNRKPLATSFEGLFVRDLSLKQIEQDFSNLQAELEQDAPKAIVKVFVGLLCDENGESFEDVQDWESIQELFSNTTIAAIMEEVGDALNPNSKK